MADLHPSHCWNYNSRTGGCSSHTLMEGPTQSFSRDHRASVPLPSARVHHCPHSRPVVPGGRTGFSVDYEHLEKLWVPRTAPAAEEDRQGGIRVVQGLICFWAGRVVLGTPALVSDSADLCSPPSVSLNTGCCGTGEPSHPPCPSRQALLLIK